MTLTVVPATGLGVVPEDVECFAIARGGAVCQGYCYPFALLQSSLITADGVTISTSPGDPGYVFGNIAGATGVSTNDIRAGKFVIALEDIADTKTGRVKVKGFVNAKVHDSDNTAITIGSALCPAIASAGANVSASSALNAHIANTGATTPRKYVGIALEALSSTPSNGTTMRVLFDGWDGIGGAGNL